MRILTKCVKYKVKQSRNQSIYAHMAFLHSHYIPSVHILVNHSTVVQFIKKHVQIMGSYITYSMKDRVLQLTILCFIAYERQMSQTPNITNCYLAHLYA
jgi:hypothetical protein